MINENKPAESRYLFEKWIRGEYEESPAPPPPPPPPFEGSQAGAEASVAEEL